jgi:hypothetical protein
VTYPFNLAALNESGFSGCPPFVRRGGRRVGRFSISILNVSLHCSAALSPSNSFGFFCFPISNFKFEIVTGGFVFGVDRRVVCPVKSHDYE